MNQQQDKRKEAYMQHSQLFLDALDRAMRSPNAVWVNSQSASGPNFYMRQTKVSAYSTLLMALHSQLRGCSLNTYISYSDAMAKGIRYGDYNGGVQIPYVRQDGYRNRLSNRLITDEEFKALSRDEAASYRPNFQRFLRMVYNIDQTNFKQANPEAYQAMLKADGPEKQRGIDSLVKECNDLQDFDDYTALYERHMVGLMPTEDQRTHYDPEQDVVYVACVGSYPDTDVFLQDGFRAMAAATGAPERLDRNISTEEAQLYEKLVQECVSAMRMAQMGRTGAISSENKALIPQWMNMITQNPRVVLNLERDVNLANEMLLRAEANEKVVKQLKPKPNITEMPIEDMLALKDIVRHGGMVTNALNYSSPEAYKAMLEKYGLGELHQKIEQCHAVLNDMESLNSRGQIKEETYIQTKSDMYKELSKLGSEMSENIVSMIPRPWDYYGRRYISNEIERLTLNNREELVLVHDPENKILNVLLPSDARSGGTVTTASGEKVDFWLDPLEQLTPEELKGATITKADPQWCDKEKVAKSLMETEGVKYVRFFETQGAMGFYPPNDYYIGKALTTSKVIDGEKTSHVLEYDISGAVHDTCAMDFSSISVIKDENGAWVMNMQTAVGENLSLYPTQADLKIFFEQCRDLTEDSLAKKKELAQKYYNLCLEDPRLNVDIFYKVPEGINPDIIARVYIYKDPKFGVQMMKPVIRGMEDVKPRPVNKSQFQKLWIAPDIDRYRKALACRIFADIIPLHYNTNPMVDEEKVAAMQRGSFIGTMDRSYADMIADRKVSGLNTSENNRNFRKGNNRRQSYVFRGSRSQSPTPSQSEQQSQSPSQSQSNSQSQSQSNSQSQSQSNSQSQGQSQSRSYTRRCNSNQTQSAENTQTQDTRGKDSYQSTSQNESQENGQNQSQDGACEFFGYAPLDPSEDIYADNTQVENYSNDVAQTSTNEEVQSQGGFGPPLSMPFDGMSVGEESTNQSTVESTAKVPEQMSLFAGEEKVDKEERSSAQTNGEAQSQNPTSYSQSNSENKGSNKVQEPAGAYNATAKSSEQSSEQSAKKDSPQASLSIELLNKHKSLLRDYPDSVIVISEDGRAKALNDDAFLAHDVIEDAPDVVYVQHPLSESPKDKIAVLEMPEDQFEAGLQKIMPRNAHIVFAYLVDELDRNNEQDFRLSM